MSVSFLFPGQGSQQEGMLHNLPSFTAVKYIIEHSSDLLHCNVLTLDTKEALESTTNVQICLFIAGVAFANVLQEDGYIPDMVLGLSIGAYPAAVVAGVLKFSDALLLVKRRGLLMEQAFPKDYGMLAILGLEAYQVEEIVQSSFTKQEPVFLANINALRQIVVSGHVAGLARIEKTILKYVGVSAKRIRISVPSHCSLLSPASQKLAQFFDNTKANQPSIPYISCRTARTIYQKEAIIEDLIINMAEQVHWHDAITLAYEKGMRFAVEMPTGEVLTKITQTSVFQNNGRAVSSMSTSLESIKFLYNKEKNNEEGLG